MRNIKLLYIFLVVSFIVASCSRSSNDPVDTEKPTIVICEPINNAHFHPGEMIHVNFDLADNVGLGSWKIDIHWAGDGHGKEGVASTQDSNTPNRWHFTLSEGDILNQRNAHIHKHIDIPAGIEGGNHHFCVYALDKAGNQAISCVDIDMHAGGHNY